MSETFWLIITYRPPKAVLVGRRMRCVVWAAVRAYWERIFDSQGPVHEAQPTVGIRLRDSDFGCSL